MICIIYISDNIYIYVYVFFSLWPTAASRRGLAVSMNSPLTTFILRNQHPCGYCIGPLSARHRAISFGMGPQWSSHQIRLIWCGKQSLVLRT